jgi:hypothetical protein
MRIFQSPWRNNELVDDILEAAQKHDLANKITGISAYNTNTNFSRLKG